MDFLPKRVKLLPPLPSRHNNEEWKFDNSKYLVFMRLLPEKKPSWDDNGEFKRAVDVKVTLDVVAMYPLYKYMLIKHDGVLWASQERNHQHHHQENSGGGTTSSSSSSCSSSSSTFLNSLLSYVEAMQGHVPWERTVYLLFSLPIRDGLPSWVSVQQSIANRVILSIRCLDNISTDPIALNKLLLEKGDDAHRFFQKLYAEAKSNKGIFELCEEPYVRCGCTDRCHFSRMAYHVNGLIQDTPWISLLQLAIYYTFHCLKTPNGKQSVAQACPFFHAPRMEDCFTKPFPLQQQQQ